MFGMSRMKRVVLLRHAKSSWDAAVTRDFDRPLNTRGRVAGVLMGQYLRREGIAWDVALVSPALRTRQSVDQLEIGYGRSLDPLYDDRLYMASTSQLLQLARGLDDAASCVLVIAHNPGIQGLALTLTPSDGGASTQRARMDAKYPTAGLCIIDVPAKRWDALAPATGRLERFVKPKDIEAPHD